MTPPSELLQGTRRKYDGLTSKVNLLRTGRGQDGLPDWPKWCFMPMGGWAAICLEEVRISNANEVAELSAVGTWQYTQGVYTFNDDLQAALLDSELNGDLPTEVFYRLPEWCLYVDTQGLYLEGYKQELAGFFVHLEWDVNRNTPELRLLLNFKTGLIPVPIPLGRWTLDEAFEKAGNTALDNAPEGSKELMESLFEKYGNPWIQAMPDIKRILSLVLYICSDEPEIDSEREPGISPKNPAEKRTKKGWRLFPAEKIRTWHIGETIGRTLAASQPPHGDENEITGRTVRTHLRRGHWHGFWRGPRSGDREFGYKWLAPTVINGK